MRGWLKILCALVFFIVLVTALATHFARHPEPEQKYSVGPPLPPGPVQPQLVCLYTGDAVLLAPDGSLWLWGGSTAASPVPVPFKAGRDSRHIAAASGGLAAIKADDTLWSWTGIGPAKTAPKQLGKDTNWSQISGNVSHYMALKRDGTLWGWGQNESDQVGGASNSTVARINSPVQVGIDTNWAAVGTGDFNSYALKRDGTLWEWGLHLTNGPGATNILEPVQFDPQTNWTSLSVGNYYVAALKSNGTIWLAVHDPNLSPPQAKPILEPFNLDSDWTELVSGQYCFYARKRDGSWWFCGKFMSYPQSRFLLWTGPLPQKIPYRLEPWAFATGGGSTLLLAKDGNLWTWGPPLPISLDERIASLFARVRTFLQPRTAQNMTTLAARRQTLSHLSQYAGGYNSDAIFDTEPHKLWSLPDSMRRSLENYLPGQTNPPPRP